MPGMPRVAESSEADDMPPEQVSRLASLYDGDEAQSEPAGQEEDANLPPLAAARGDAVSDDSSTDQPALSSSGGMPDISGMFAKNPRVRAADAKLDNIIAQMTARQQALMDQHQQNGSAMPLLALASGLLSPTRTGGFSESIGSGIREAMPVIQQERQQDRADQQGLFGLRLKAATLEQERARMEAMRTYQANLARIQRGDKYAMHGMKLDDNGNPHVDPSLMEAIEKPKIDVAKASARAHVDALIDAFSGGRPGQLGSQLTDEELKEHNLPPGTSATHAPMGQIKVLNKPNTEVMTGTDDQGHPIYRNKDADLSPEMKTHYQNSITRAKDVLPQLNALIDQIDSGQIDSGAVGITGKAATLAGNVIGAISGSKNVTFPQDTNFKERLGLLGPEIHQILARNPDKSMGGGTKTEDKEIDPYIPGNDWFQTRAGLREKLVATRDKIMDTAKGRAPLLGSADIYSPHFDEWFNQKANLNYKPVPNVNPHSNSGGATVHDELPDPSKFVGKTATDTTTGKKFRSDGKSWSPL